MNSRVKNNFSAGWIREDVSPGYVKDNWSAQSSLCGRRGEKRALEPNILPEGCLCWRGAKVTLLTLFYLLSASFMESQNYGPEGH